MPFESGQSGNPKGRPAGTKNKRSLIAREFEKSGSDVAKLVVEKAKAGDMRAIDIVLSRLEPPLRPEARRVEFEFDPNATVGEQASAVMEAVSSGRVDPDTGRMLLDMLSALAGLRDIDSFLADMKALQASKRKIPGGVVYEQPA